MLSQQFPRSSCIYSNSEPVTLETYWWTSEEAWKAHVCRLVHPPTLPLLLGSQQHSSRCYCVPEARGYWCQCFNKRKSTLLGCSNKPRVNFITLSVKRICELQFTCARHRHSKTHCGLLFVTVIVVVTGKIEEEEGNRGDEDVPFQGRKARSSLGRAVVAFSFRKPSLFTRLLQSRNQSNPSQ